MAVHLLSSPHSTHQNLQLSISRLPSRRSTMRPSASRSRGRRSIKVRCEGTDHGFYMRRCVELARKAAGFTSPNPMVGCVIVKDGEIVGEGFHPKAGQPHAELLQIELPDHDFYMRWCVSPGRRGVHQPEPDGGLCDREDAETVREGFNPKAGQMHTEVFALKDAGVLAENATAYVSLEPCNHYGRTPPCTEALIRSKVKQVVIGMVDPNPIVASKGVERLRESGIEVIAGVEEMLCRKLNEAYIHRMITGKPFVALRYSLSFNGRILNKLGQGADESGGYYSKLLQEYDGVLISSNLFTRTSRLPTSYETGASQPLQIIVSRGAGSLSHLPRVTAESSAKMIILAENTSSIEPEFEGTEVVVLEQLNLSSILDYCASRGLCSILLDFSGDCDGLSVLLQEGFERNLVQKVVMEMHPFWDTSEEISTLAFGKKSFSLKDVISSTSNESIVIEGYIA